MSANRLVLLQAYDPAHWLKRRAEDPSTRLDADALRVLQANAERDLALALCFGATATMPVSYLTDSPLFLMTFGRLHPAYEKFQEIIGEGFAKVGFGPLNRQWKPIRMTVTADFHSLQQIAASYVWAPARFAAFEGMPAELQSKRVVDLCNHLSQGRYREASKLAQVSAYEETYERLIRYFDQSAVLRPSDSAAVNYADHFEVSLVRLRNAGKDALAAELEKRVRELYRKLDTDPLVLSKKITGRDAAGSFRGAWYFNSDLFEGYWPDVGGILDNLNVTQVLGRWGIRNANFLNPVFKPRPPKKVDESLQLSGLSEARDTRDVPVVDWSKFWESYSNPDMLRAISMASAELDGSRDEGASYAVFARHAEKIATHIEGLGLSTEDILAKAERDRFGVGRARDWADFARSIGKEALGYLDITPGKVLSTSINAAAEIPALKNATREGAEAVRAFWSRRRMRTLEEMERKQPTHLGDAINDDIAEIRDRAWSGQGSEVVIGSFFEAKAGDVLSS